MDQHDDLLAAALEAVNSVSASKETGSAAANSGKNVSADTDSFLDDDFDLEISITSFDDILNDAIKTVDSEFPEFPEAHAKADSAEKAEPVEKAEPIETNKASEATEVQEKKPAIVRPLPTVHVTPSTIRPKAASVRLLPSDASTESAPSEATAKATSEAETASKKPEPVASIKAPVSEAAKPVSEAAKPVSEAAKPVSEAAKPVSEAAKSVSPKPVIKPKFTFPKSTILGARTTVNGDPSANEKTTAVQEPAVKTLLSLKPAVAAESAPKPAVAPKPVLVTRPVFASKPLFAAKPVATSEPVATPKHIVGAKPVAVSAPVAEPEAAVAPEAVAEPEAAVTPEVAVEPVVAPEAVAEPVVASEAVAEPVVASEAVAEPVVVPEAAAVPEPVVVPEVAVAEESVVAEPVAAAGVEPVAVPETVVSADVQNSAVSAEVVAGYEAQIAELKGRLEEVSHALEETYKRALELHGENEQLKAVQKQFNDRLIRVTADFDNYRKRVVRDQEQNKYQAEERIVLSFLPVMDNLSRAIIHAQQSQDYQQLLQGVVMTGKMYLSTLAKNGCVPFDSMGVEFDPAYHDVLQRVVDPDKPHNTIVQEHLKGYIMHDKVIRPALVVVAQHEDESEGGNV
ncbi:MAG: nucleotide exchange factor GrpE [Proteobacteria bacterium]|nr:nucleotide exchange factor GrpE [Pseudomonadota bacterium]